VGIIIFNRMSTDEKKKREERWKEENKENKT